MTHITISQRIAFKCAEALVAEHNAIPQDEKHDNCLIVSFRSLYQDLCALGFPTLIASAHRPINPKGVELYPKFHRI